MKTTHTPGPWTVCSDCGYLAIRQDPFAALSDVKTRKTLNVATIETEDGEANARIIAAAPELLAALKGTVNMLDTLEAANADLYARLPGIHKTLAYCNARAALSKAEGAK